MKQYDYIFTGAGAAGLSLLCRMIASERFNDQKILVIDRSDKQDNDRTWCYWEKHVGFFDALVYKKYQRLWFYSDGYQARHDIYPYQYKLLRGIDFYNYCLALIQSRSNIEWIHEDVTAIETEDTTAYVTVGEQRYQARYIFNSILFDRPQQKEKDLELLQHFKGWIINTPNDCFDPEAATLMDFRVRQEHGTTFVYVMPFSNTRALVEFTLFSRELLDQQQYEAGLRSYINDYLGIKEYSIEETEYGVIPMTTYRFPRSNKRIMNIGTAGGQTKASSGYTFQFIQKDSAHIVDSLIKSGSPFYEEPISEKRFAFYDNTLINILYNDKLEGARIFTELFQKNKITDVLEFLDNETSIMQELRLISVLPTKVFMQAALQQLF